MINETNPSSTQPTQGEKHTGDDVLKLYREYFRNFDVDGDGKLCKTEFMRMAENLGVELDVKELKRAYHAADCNGDGVITFKEFLTAYSREVSPQITLDSSPISSPKRLDGRRSSYHQLPSNGNMDDTVMKKCRGYFQNLDINADGKLSKKEFLKMMKKIGKDYDAPQLEKAYYEVDRTRDGGISFKEFTDAYMKERTSCPKSPSRCPKSPSRSDRSRSSTISNIPSQSIQGASNKSDALLIEFRKYFHESDTNDDGKLGWSEFLQLTEHVGIKLQARQLAKAYQTVDKSGDGKISYKEFFDAYTNEFEPEKVERYTENRRRSVSATEYDNRFSPRGSDNRHRFGSVGPSSPSPTRERVSDWLSIHQEAPSSARLTNLSGSELTEYFKCFWYSDKDCDGKLSAYEFSKMLEALGMKLNNRDLHKAFTVADTDADGLISFNEYLSAYFNRNIFQVLSPEQIKKRFGKTNKTGNCILTRYECFQIMKLLGNDLDEKHFDKLMRVMDDNKDGHITLNKFYCFLGINV